MKSSVSGKIFFLAPILIFCAIQLRAQSYLGKIIFGNAASEASHSFTGPLSFAITNNSILPAQTARRCLTNNPATVNGGSLTFSLKVDPTWRSSKTEQACFSGSGRSIY